MGTHHPEQRGPGDCSSLAQYAAAQTPVNPTTTLLGKFKVKIVAGSHWRQKRGQASRRASTWGSPPDFLSQRPLPPVTAAPRAGPPLSLLAHGVFLTCHLLPLCRSADKGPREITESISAASVGQRLLSMSRGGPSPPAQLLRRRDTEGRQAGPGALQGPCIPFVGVSKGGPCPCLLRSHITPLLRMQIGCSVFPFPQSPTGVREGSIS